jgi:hypothetical protein
MSRILTESQLKSLIRRTLREGFPEFSATPSYGHPDETSPQPAPATTPDYAHKYRTYLHFSGLSFKDALLQFLHQHIDTLFNSTHSHQNTINKPSQHPTRDPAHPGIDAEITASIRHFLVDYCEFPGGQGQETQLRGFRPLVGAFQSLLSKPFISQLLLNASAPSEQLAQEIYQACLQYPLFKSHIEPEANQNLGQILSQFYETQAIQSNQLSKLR